jgi:hypothetical protein
MKTKYQDHVNDCISHMRTTKTSTPREITKRAMLQRIEVEE